MKVRDKNEQNYSYSNPQIIYTYDENFLNKSKNFLYEIKSDNEIIMRIYIYIDSILI